MTFFEAVEYARKGKKIKLNSCAVFMEWRDDCLVWSGSCHPVTIKQSILDATWSVAKPKYTFSEAYAMMKQGRKMKSVQNRVLYIAGEWCEQGNVYRTVAFLPEEIEGKWVEVE